MDEALENWSAGACGWREVDVNVCDKGGCCICNEDERDEATESNYIRVSIFRMRHCNNEDSKSQ